MKRSAFRPALPGWAAAAVMITGSLHLPGCGDTEEDRGGTRQTETEDAGSLADGSTADAGDAAGDAEPQDAAIPPDTGGDAEADDDASIVGPGICPV
jgi:hypothetical protein